MSYRLKSFAANEMNIYVYIITTVCDGGHETTTLVAAHAEMDVVQINTM